MTSVSNRSVTGVTAFCMPVTMFNSWTSMGSRLTARATSTPCDAREIPRESLGSSCWRNLFSIFLIWMERWLERWWKMLDFSEDLRKNMKLNEFLLALGIVFVKATHSVKICRQTSSVKHLFHDGFHDESSFEVSRCLFWANNAWKTATPPQMAAPKPGLKLLDDHEDSTRSYRDLQGIAAIEGVLPRCAHPSVYWQICDNSCPNDSPSQAVNNLCENSNQDPKP